MLRTIKSSLYQRLVLQAEEAEQQNLTKTANFLVQSLESQAGNVREDEASYLYSEAEYRADVEKYLWDIIVRTADFHDINIDAQSLLVTVESLATQIIPEIRVKLGAPLVGAYENHLPGEEITNEKIMLEVSND